MYVSMCLCKPAKKGGFVSASAGWLIPPPVTCQWSHRELMRSQDVGLVLRGLSTSSGHGRPSSRHWQYHRALERRRTALCGGLSWVSPELTDLRGQWGQEPCFARRQPGCSVRRPACWALQRTVPQGWGLLCCGAGRTPTAAQAALFCLLLWLPSLAHHPRKVSVWGPAKGL